MSAEQISEWPDLPVRSEPSGIGRPREYDEALALAVLDGVAESGSLRKTCRDLNIPWQTVRAWKTRDPSFAAHLARVREESADALIEDGLDIVDDPAVGLSHEAVGQAKLRSEYRKWLASKYAAAKYGDKLELAGDLTVSVVLKRFTPDPVEAAIDVSPTVERSGDK